MYLGNEYLFSISHKSSSSWASGGPEWVTFGDTDKEIG